MRGSHSILIAAVFAFGGFFTDAALAQQTAAVGYTDTDPFFQLPVNVLAAVTGTAANPSTVCSLCPPTASSGPDRIDFLITTQGSVVDAQSRRRRATNEVFDARIHWERLVTTTSPLPGTIDTTTTYKAINNLSSGGQSRIEISTTIRTSSSKQSNLGTRLLYEISGVTSVARTLTASEAAALRAAGL